MDPRPSLFKRVPFDGNVPGLKLVRTIHIEIPVYMKDLPAIETKGIETKGSEKIGSNFIEEKDVTKNRMTSSDVKTSYSDKDTSGKEDMVGVNINKLVSDVIQAEQNGKQGDNQVLIDPRKSNVIKM